MDILQNVFKQNLPQVALKQIAEISLLLLDRIFKIPNDWLKVLTPIILWMTLHMDDNLVRYMFKLQPILNQELSRLHQLVSHFINEQYLIQKLKDDEDQQMKILKLMGTTLIPEENQFNGFMPLKSYLINKKEIKTGVMCPQDQEELIRALILKDALEKLDCTYEKFQDTDKIAKKKKKVVEEDKKQEDDIFKQIDEQNQDIKDMIASGQGEKPLIVLDAQNVAMKHGRDKLFSVKGIHIAVNYWHKNGHKVICFLPEYLFDYEQVETNKKLKEKKLKDTKASKLPDDIPLLHKLMEKDFLVKTPAQDYDDSYSIQYARKFNAFMVTNDKFRDYLDAIDQDLKTQESSHQHIDKPLPVDKSSAKKSRDWIKAHSVIYTFNKDEFLPNPQAKIWQHASGLCQFDEYRNYPVGAQRLNGDGDIVE